MAGVKRGLYSDSDIHALHKVLDEVSCPICIDHPHNAVLLLCSSHEKGCRSYICDTSYRHSNCLDRFRKMRDNSRGSTNLPSSLPVNSFRSSNNSDTSFILRNHMIEDNENDNVSGNNNQNSMRMPEGHTENLNQGPNRQLETQGESILEAGGSETFREITELEGPDMGNSTELGLSLKCPLCRGTILGWEVVEDVRQYLNLKKRSCSRESCSFLGNYQELRRHARRVHPTTRPSEIDPSREQAWRCLERQREYGDIVSAIRSAMPGAVVIGDYAVEDGDRMLAERESGTGEVNAPWLTTLFLFQMVGSFDGVAEPRARSRAWVRHRRPAGPLPERRFLWGENLLGIHDDDDDDENDLHLLSDASEDAYPIRRRRRLNRSRSNDQS